MLKVLFLGTSAARPTVERNVSGLVVTREGESLLFECGEGTQRQMMRYGVSFALSDIFFTHFHADHFLGIIGLIRTLGLQGRTEPMRFFGPRGAKRVLGAALGLGVERATFEVEIVEVEPGQTLSRGDYEIRAFAVEHGGGALGYALVEKDRLGRFNPDRARELGVPEGPLWGKLQRSQSVTLEDRRVVGPESIVGAPRPGRKLVYTGDTRPCAAAVDAAAEADLLVHEATFGEEEAERARETLHATAREAAQVALAAGVRRLVLTHLSARYSRDPAPLLEEARGVFAETVVAKDGMEIEVAFRE
ncbi:MAG: ribonuclease Z [Gemmatimonadetes bacterium GWC2_71_9]|nr:MAG: ribonuclease Z [Gemmatimonadetes bacterium GWC2_71_9]OGT97323.1 MAG: ribonuclease Z [Gemmatimonadetes bacterium RIFCSPLOWO2_02_FULL_71_11]